MRIAFLWQGLNGRYGVWNDGLRAAMRIIEAEHVVRYFDFPLDGIEDFNPDVVLYWEAPCTLKGKDADNYHAVLNLPYKKALLFAGGPVEAHTCYGFDLFFVESRINEEEFEKLGLPWKRAFGVNTQVMKPRFAIKQYTAFMQATFADWKRHTLFAEAMGKDGAVAGRLQEHDRNGYDKCLELGVTIFPEQEADAVSMLINQSICVLNTASYWGGGQRCTLEAMACGVPVIAMSDSPKNAEFVQESGAGFIVEPTPLNIGVAVELIKSRDEMGLKGYQYVMRNWTEFHYATALLDGIRQICA